MDNGTFKKVEAGTPQGGVISPLLANIALDGMIRETMAKFPRKGNAMAPVRIIRYADDFVVLHPQLEVLKAKEAIQDLVKTSWNGTQAGKNQNMSHSESITG
jgi:RNA-directed DNA polymerase